jgi:glycosyltransferase involved in cell wall biosynthesis
MKIGFVGNMNNHFFAAVRHLRDVGIDAELVMHADDPEHFHPSYDTFSRNFIDFTKTVYWGAPTKFSSVSPKEIEQSLARYDRLVVTGSAPAFLHRIGRAADVFIPYGSDLAEMPFFGLAQPKKGALASLLTFPYHQRRGIQKAHTLAGAYAAQFDRVFTVLNAGGKRDWFPIPPLYAGEFSPENVPNLYGRSAWYHEFKRVRESCDILLFHHTRHIWKSNATELSHKGNDKLFRALARTIAKYPDVRYHLICLEYGPDVEASRELIEDLGIARNVTFFPLMGRKELFVGISLSDIVCAEYAVSWNFGGTIIEGIAMAKPLLHYRNDALYEKSELFPIMNAFTDEEMAAHLGVYTTSPAPIKADAQDAYQWFNRHIIETSMTRFKQMFGRS